MGENNEYTDNNMNNSTEENSNMSSENNSSFDSRDAERRSSYINAGSTGNNMANSGDGYYSSSRNSSYSSSDNGSYSSNYGNGSYSSNSSSDNNYYSSSDNNYYSTSNNNYNSSSDNRYNGSDNNYYGSSDNGNKSGKKAKKTKTGGKKILQKACAIALSALLFGGVAGGSMVGIQYAAQKAGVVSTTEESSAAAATIHTTDTSTTSSSSSAGTGSVGDVSDIVEKVLPSVVAITNTQVYETYNTNPWSYFYGGSSGSTEQTVTGAGSGIIIGQNDTELLIVTNEHVIDSADSLTITFADESTADASLKGSDEDNDLAVVAVQLSDISSETMNSIAIATLHTADDLEVGQGVIAIGNALGYGQSITVGYISALNRSVSTSDGTTQELIQTDAAINPGNSGGALINANGEIVGINSAKYSDTDVEGMGFAIPISKVSSIIDDLMNQETKTEVAEENRGYLGIQGVNVTSSNPLMTNMPAGCYVYTILDGGAASASDLQEGDIITKVNGTTVSDMDALQTELKYYAIGDTVTLTVERLNSSTKEYEETTVTVTLQKQVDTSSTSQNSNGSNSGSSSQGGAQNGSGSMGGSSNGGSNGSSSSGSANGTSSNFFSNYFNSNN